jgi:hypothetical protein
MSSRAAESVVRMDVILACPPKLKSIGSPRRVRPSSSRRCVFARLTRFDLSSAICGQFLEDGRSSDRAVSENIGRADEGVMFDRRRACQRRSEAHDRGRKMGPLGADQGTAAFVVDATRRVLERRTGRGCRSTLARLGNFVAVGVRGLGCEGPTITVGGRDRRGRRKRKGPEGPDHGYDQQPCGYSAAHVPPHQTRFQRVGR